MRCLVYGTAGWRAAGHWRAVLGTTVAATLAASFGAACAARGTARARPGAEPPGGRGRATRDTLARDSVSVRGPEARAVVGVYLPIGDFRALLSDAPFAGVQAGYAFLPEIALTGSAGVARTRDRTAARAAGITMLQLDLAAEARFPQAARFGPPRTPWSVSPYLALGIGTRAYAFRAADARGRPDTVPRGRRSVSFGGVGLDLSASARRTQLRLESRIYVTTFRGIAEAFDPAEDHNELVLLAGLALPLARPGRTGAGAVIVGGR